MMILLTLIGILLAYKLLFYLYRVLLALIKKPVDIKKKFNTDTVIITGASSGVGRQLALLCAKQGLNIIGVGRDEQKLKCVAEECRKERIEFTEVAQDLGYVDSSDKVFEVTKGHRVGALFLVHGGYYINKLSDKDDENIIMDVNSSFLTEILLVKKFINQSNNCGTVTFVSSVNSFMPIPFAQIYVAGKGGVNQFFECMQMEGLLNGITFQTINASYIKDTDIARGNLYLKKSTEIGMAPIKVAEAILSTAGTNYEFDLGYQAVLFHFIKFLIPKFILNPILTKISNKILEMKKKYE